MKCFIVIPSNVLLRIGKEIVYKLNHVHWNQRQAEKHQRGYLKVIVQVKQISHSSFQIHIFFFKYSDQYVTSFNNPVSVEVVYTDYDNVAIIHECHVPNEDGSCPLEHRHIDVLSRDHEGPREGSKRRMGPIALQLCVRRRDFRKTSKPG